MVAAAAAGLKQGLVAGKWSKILYSVAIGWLSRTRGAGPGFLAVQKAKFLGAPTPQTFFPTPAGFDNL
jgi:hypothetical protein